MLNNEKLFIYFCCVPVYKYYNIYILTILYNIIIYILYSYTCRLHINGSIFETSKVIVFIFL